MKSQNVKFTVEYNPLKGNAKQVVKTIVTIEDCDDYIYYSYEIRDNEGQLIAGKSMPFSKSLIDAGNELDFAIKHAVYNIENFRINRTKVFKVMEITKL